MGSKNGRTWMLTISTSTATPNCFDSLRSHDETEFFLGFSRKKIQNPANLLRRGALRTCNDPSLSHVSTSRLCRGRLLVFAVQSIMTLLETAIANMVELVLLIIAQALIEAKTFFCSVWCHPEPLPFDLPLEEVDLPCLWDSTRPNATGDRTACCIRRGA